MPWKPHPEGEWAPFPSLGPLLSAWVEDNLVIPDGSDAGKPLTLSDDQYDHLYNLFRLDPNYEYDPDVSIQITDAKSRIYSSSVYSRSKGSGKSPVMAALCWAFALGPVSFCGWDDEGQPMAQPHPSPHIQIIGFSQDNTKNLWRALLDCSDVDNGAPLLLNYPEVTALKTRIDLPNGLVEFVTTSAGSREGQRVTFGVIEESGYLTKANGGVAVAETLNRNLDKMSGTRVEISNAYVPGQKSVMEISHDQVKAHEAGTAMGSLQLYWDHREMPADVDIKDPKALREGLEFCYQGSPWVSIDRIISAFYNIQNRIENSRRFFGNQITSAVDSWMSVQEWDSCAVPKLFVDTDDQITLGFDGSVREDSTALVGCRISDGHLFLLGVWEKPANNDNWEVPKLEVDSAVDRAFEDYKVVGFYGDPAYWSDRLDAWYRKYRHRLKVKSGSQTNPMYFAMNRNMAVVQALDRFHQAATTKALSHDGNPVLRQHILNCRRRDSRVGIQVAKEFPTSPHKIDAAMSAVLAYEAAATFRRENKQSVQRKIHRIA